jgi:hypothetical protein
MNGQNRPHHRPRFGVSMWYPIRYSTLPSRPAVVARLVGAAYEAESLHHENHGTVGWRMKVTASTRQRFLPSLPMSFEPNLRPTAVARFRAMNSARP